MEDRLASEIRELAKICIKEGDEKGKPVFAKEKDGVQYCSWLTIEYLRLHSETGEATCPYADLSVEVVEEIDPIERVKRPSPINTDTHPGCKYCKRK